MGEVIVDENALRRVLDDYRECLKLLGSDEYHLIIDLSDVARFDLDQVMRKQRLDQLKKGLCYLPDEN